MSSAEIRPDTFSGYYEEEVFSAGLSREDTIERQVRIVSDNYSKGEWDKFEYSLKMLISLLPSQLRNRYTVPQHKTDLEGIEKHYQLFIRIQEDLETDTNMIFKKKFIKTYE